MASEPFEVIAAPFEIYSAPVGEPFPSIDTTPPGGNWVLIGKNGARSYSEDGVSITHEESVSDFRTLDSVGPIKAFRTSEDLIIALTIHDVRLEEQARVLNFNTIVDNSGDTPPNKVLEFYRGPQVNFRALLVRGPSPYMDGGLMQYEVPKVRSGASPEVVYQKGEPAGLALEFRAMEDLNAASDAERFGRITAQSGT